MTRAQEEIAREELTMVQVMSIEADITLPMLVLHTENFARHYKPLVRFKKR